MVTNLVHEMVTRMPVQPLARAMSRWVAPRRRNDHDVRQLLDRILRPTSNCVDVGAFPGTILREIVCRAGRGHHLACEPRLDQFARLKERFPQVKLLNVAAAEGPGDGFIPCRQRPIHPEGHSCQDGDAGSKLHAQRVLAARLDDIVPADLAVRFLKIDAPGAELQALRGGLGVIRRCHPFVLLELGDMGDRPSAELYDFLTQNALAVSLLGGWLRGHSPIGRDVFVGHCRPAQPAQFLAHP